MYSSGIHDNFGGRILHLRIIIVESEKSKKLNFLLSCFCSDPGKKSHQVKPLTELRMMLPVWLPTALIVLQIAWGNWVAMPWMISPWFRSKKPPLARLHKSSRKSASKRVRRLLTQPLIPSVLPSQPWAQAETSLKGRFPTWEPKKYLQEVLSPRSGTWISQRR